MSYVEKDMVNDVEDFFVEDSKVGIPFIDKLDHEIVEDFKDAFASSGIEVLIFNDYRMDFEIQGDRYFVELDSVKNRCRLWRLI